MVLSSFKKLTNVVIEFWDALSLPEMIAFSKQAFFGSQFRNWDYWSIKLQAAILCWCKLRRKESAKMFPFSNIRDAHFSIHFFRLVRFTYLTKTYVHILSYFLIFIRNSKTFIRSKNLNSLGWKSKLLRIGYQNSWGSGHPYPTLLQPTRRSFRKISYCSTNIELLWCWLQVVPFRRIQTESTLLAQCHIHWHFCVMDIKHSKNEFPRLSFRS